MGDFSKDINSTFPNDKVKASLNLIYTANWLSCCQNEFFKPFGISPQQYNILRILRGAKKRLKVQIVKERMLERSPNATRLMDKLCDKNLMKRTRCDDDRRVVYVEISSDGLALLKSIDMSQKKDFLENLTKDEARQLSALLDKIR